MIDSTVLPPPSARSEALHVEDATALQSVTNLGPCDGCARGSQRHQSSRFGTGTCSSLQLLHATGELSRAWKIQSQPRSSLSGSGLADNFLLCSYALMRQRRYFSYVDSMAVMLDPEFIMPSLCGPDSRELGSMCPQPCAFDERLKWN